MRKKRCKGLPLKIEPLSAEEMAAFDASPRGIQFAKQQAAWSAEFERAVELQRAQFDHNGVSR